MAFWLEKRNLEEEEFLEPGEEKKEKNLQFSCVFKCYQKRIG